MMDFIEPDSPSLEPIHLLHRGNDGYITFHSKDDQGTLTKHWAIRARDLDGIFPQLSPLLERDAYFSLNAFYRPAHYPARNTPPELGLKGAHRDNDSVRWLTANYVDIDCHALGIKDYDAIASILKFQDEGLIPPASLINRSGRGIWLVWFLASEDGKGLQDAFPENIQLWAAVQREIGNRLAGIGSDANARDAARIARVPGSINSKSESRVCYWIQANEHGQKYTYTLPSIASFFNVSISRGNRNIESAASEMQRQKGFTGQRARWKHARDQFGQLWASRGTFGEGMRNNAVLIYTTILQGVQELSQADIQDEVLRLVESFPQEPEPFTLKEMKAAMKAADGMKFGKITNQKISDMLHITPQEAEMLKSWKPSRALFSPDHAPDEGLTRGEEQDRRRRALKSLIEKIGGVPPLRDIVGMMSEEFGIDAAPETYKRDLVAIGRKNPRTRKSRKKKTRKNERKLFKDK